MRLIDPAIFAAFEKCKTNNPNPKNANFWFQFRLGEDKSSRVGGHVLDLYSPTGQSSVHRARYLDEIIALIPKEIAHFGKRLDSVTEHEDHVLIKFQDGTTARYSAIIGCDGVKSKTRKLILGEDSPATNPQFTGKYAYRGLIPMEEAVKALGDDIARNSQLWLGHHGHVLTFPIEQGNTMNVVAFRSKHDGKWEDEQWVKPMKKEDMYSDFSGWVDAVQDIIGMMQKPDMWALFDHPPADTYTRGRMCLLGDSAHASTPHNGAGAGMAIEDALVMSNIMSLVYESKDIPRAFKAYDQARRPRSQRLVTSSREQGMLYDMELPGIGGDLEAIKRGLEDGRKWIWNFDMQAHVEEAKKLYVSLKD